MGISTPFFNHFSASISLNNLPDDLDFVDNFAQKLVDKLELTVVKTMYHKFNPYGITFIYILSQSHLAIHTWPENNFIHIDLVSCKPLIKEKLEEDLISVFEIFEESIIKLDVYEK